VSAATEEARAADRWAGLFRFLAVSEGASRSVVGASVRRRSHVGSACAQMTLRLLPWRRGTANRDAIQAAFEEMLAPCWDQLWRYAYRMTGHRDDAEDLLSEAVLEALRSFHQYRGETSFLRWMYRIVSTTRIDMLRRARRRPSVSLDGYLEGDGDGPRDIEAPGSAPERILLEPALGEEVQAALSSLPEPYRAAVILADIEGLEYEEVSRILGVPVGTVRSRLHRARRLLKVALADYVKRLGGGPMGGADAVRHS